MAHLITVVPHARRFAVPKSTPFVLQQGDWDDFGFKTTCALYYNESDGSRLIGGLKILRSGQDTSKEPIVPVGETNGLGEGWCSLGQDLDYYQRISELPYEAKGQILRALQDVIQNSNLIPKFKDEKGWADSITRFISEEHFELARATLAQDYRSIPKLDTAISFKIPEWEDALTIDYQVVENPDGVIFGDSAKEPDLAPTRIAVLVGRNGAGKSTILARLARVAHAPMRDRRKDILHNLGVLSPGGIGFSRVVTVSYSAFDAFEIPGVTYSDRKQIASDIGNDVGRFIYLGIRDIGAEVQVELDNIQEDEDYNEEVSSGDRRPETVLKPLTQLADEFVRTIQSLTSKGLGRRELFEESIKGVLSDQSFNWMADKSVATLLGEDARETFLGWSTGYKIIFQILSGLAAHVEPKSLVLIDEPETHLHPPLLAALMHGVRLILRQQDAFGIVSTHSPVVAQETLGKHVFIIKREGSKVTIRPPRIESFGENIGEITDEIFGLSVEAADYHRTLKDLADRSTSIGDAETRFGSPLSSQARAYVMSEIMARTAKSRG